MDPVHRPEDEHPPTFPHTQFAFVATIGITMLYYLSSSIVALSLGITSMEDERIVLLQAAAQLGFLFVPALVALRFSALGPRKLLRLDRPKLTARTWMVVALCFILVQCCVSSWDVIQQAILPTSWNSWLDEFSQATEKALSSMLRGDDMYSLVRAVFVIALVPAFAEELLFRGLMQRSLEESLGVGVAILNTALLFAVMHINPQAIIPLFVLSLVLGRIAQRSASLLPGIVLHFCNNLFAVIAYQNTTLRALDQQSPLGLPLSIGLFIVSIVGLTFALRMMPQTEPIREPG